MSLFVRCNWLPPQDATLSDRFSEVRRQLTTNPLVSKLGPHWFLGGRLKKDALKREVRLEEFGPKQKGCKRVSLGTTGKAYWALYVWNGGPDDESAGLTVMIRDPSDEVDQIVFSPKLDVLPRTMAWSDVLEAARQLSEQLGGYTIVSSHELIDECKRRGIVSENPAVYAYAAFWGVDRSGRNPLYRWLAATGCTAPFELVAGDSWAEVNAPDDARLREITESLAGVEAEAREATPPPAPKSVAPPKMEIIVRCQWWPPRDATLSDRFSEVRRLVATNALLMKLGPRWFQFVSRGGELKQREVGVEDFDVGLKGFYRGFQRETLDDSGKPCWALWGLRNGDPYTAGLGVTICDPSSQADEFWIQAEVDFMQQTMAWSDVLGAVRQLTEQLGAYAVVYSDELIDECKRRGIAHADRAAYAAFWGVDRSGRDPKHQWLATTGHTAPYAIVACDSWEDVSAADDARLREIAGDLPAFETDPDDKGVAAPPRRGAKR